MSLNILKDVQDLKIDNPNKMLGKGLQMPFSASNSGSRKLMFGIQLEHRLPLLKPEVPYIQTGYEMEFGKNSSSYVCTDDNLEVVGIVPKFSFNPRHHFYVFAISEDSKTVEVFERKEYKHITENYGYLFDNNRLDNLIVGDTLPKGTVIQKSMAFDEYDNRMDGCNLLTMYNACEDTMEDAIVISESASKKLASPLVKKVNIIINDNDIPLNLYGDDNNYKIFPDIGEESVNSILCGLRREKKEECLYSQSYSRLKELSISDERYTVSGRVVDINIYCNAPDRLDQYMYNAQLKKYYDENIRMSNDIINIIKPYVDEGYKLSYDLQRLYSISKGCVSGKQYFSERVFSNIVLEITLVEEIDVARGDKLSNRYGGKGITAKIKPDALMPRTKSGEVIDVILNMCGVYGRENAGQLFEITLSYICIKILEFINLNILDIDEIVDMYLSLIKIVSPSMYDYTEKFLERLSDEECVDFIAGICANEKSFYLVIEPVSENMTIDKVEELYKTFDWIKPETVLMPIKDSAGKIRYVDSRRPLVYGYQYIYRLKQYAEEKFSVTSLSATNTKNENSKSKNSNNYKALYSRTPIRFGDMETGNLTHLGAELIVQMLMLYSTSPHARRLTSELLTGDPFDVDIKLDMDSKNRNVEILNAYLKTMGLKLVFKRIPKKKKQAIYIKPMSFYDEYNEPREPLVMYADGERVDLESIINKLIDQENRKDAMKIPAMSFFDEVKEDEEES